MTHNFYYSSPSLLPWCGRPLQVLYSPCCGRTFSSSRRLSGGRIQAWRRRRESFIPWSIGGVFSSSLEVHLIWPNLARRRRRCFGGFSSRKIVAHTTSEVRRGIRQKTQRFLFAKEKVYQYLISTSYLFYFFEKYQIQEACDSSISNLFSMLCSFVFLFLVI